MLKLNVIFLPVFIIQLIIHANIVSCDSAWVVPFTYSREINSLGLYVQDMEHLEIGSSSKTEVAVMHEIMEAQNRLSTLLLEAHTQVLAVARQVDRMSTNKKSRVPVKPVGQIQKQRYCGFCKKPGHLKRHCRKMLGLCLICGAADHQLVNCPAYVPRE